MFLSKMSQPGTLPELITRNMGQCEYLPIWNEMRDYTQTRDQSSPDQIWYLQHPPVYTLGLNGKRQHILQESQIPIIAVDRGGQITYHGPGQLIAYLLIDIQRLGIGVRDLVNALEQATIDYLADHDIMASRKKGAPGIYVDGAKIAALGLRVKQGKTYHGIAFNIDMDLKPFSFINPCGYEGMPVTQLASQLGVECPSIDKVKFDLHTHFCRQLGYNAP